MFINKDVINTEEKNYDSLDKECNAHVNARVWRPVFFLDLLNGVLGIISLVLLLTEWRHHGVSGGEG